MTEENYKYRTSPLLLRNQFKGEGTHRIPVIPRAKLEAADFENLLLLGFDRTRLEGNNHLERMVHFFLYDYKFERVWKSPDADIEKLKRYRAVLSPDFSMYLEMNPTMQLYNTFRNRWCGAYFAMKGIRVIPTVSWGDENTFDFCFKGIPKGSTVAVSTLMVSEHGSHADQKAFFMKGYNELLRQIEPERIICYNDPFPEMQGNIVFVDYELSSWKYQNDDYTPSKFVKYICGVLPVPEDSGILIKKGHIASLEEEKGMGSAHGGKWKPKKPEAERFFGPPGESLEFTLSGYTVRVKYGEDGRAVKERHYTDHLQPRKHTDPHDHIILWDAETGIPIPQKAINYPDGAPEFKIYGGGIHMDNEKGARLIEENRFETISDFTWSVDHGAEVVIAWKGKGYSITHPEGKINIAEGYYIKDGVDYNFVSHEKCEDSEGKWCDTADEALEYIVSGDRLRDVITQVDVLDRTL